MGQPYRYLIVRLITTFLTLLCLTGCSKPKKSFHIYMVFSPINPDSLKLAKQVLVNAKDNVIDTTQIIAPPNYYTIGEICKTDEPEFPTPKQLVIDQNASNSVSSQIERSLKAIEAKQKECNATVSALINLSTNLNQAALATKSEKLIIFIQAPWSKQKISDETLNMLREKMNKLAQSGQVEKIILFGIDQDGADRLGKSFQAFNAGGISKFDSGTDINQTVEFLKRVKSEYLR